GEVPGEVLPAVVPARDEADADPEDQREADVEDRPAGGLADRGLVRLAHVREELVDEEEDRHCDRDDPDERRDVHVYSRGWLDGLDAKVSSIPTSGPVTRDALASA